MVDELIDHFSKKLSARKLVFQYMKGWALLFWMSLFLLFGGIILSLFYKSMFVIAGILLFIFATYQLNRKAKQVIYNQYDIVVETSLWSADSQFHNYIQNQIEIYLSDRQLVNEKKLDSLIKQLSKRAESSKSTIFFLPGLFIVLILPVWTQFEIVLFKGVDVKTAVFLLVIQLFLLAFLVYIVSFVKHIADDLTTLKRQRILQLINHLEDILLNHIDKKKDEGKLRLVRRRKLL
jgi:flagellar basal body-associated protein FliL